jgi:hypothetical protein
VTARALLLVLALSLAAAGQGAPMVTVKADFGNRRDLRFAVPPGMLGAQLGWIPNGFYKQRTALGRLRDAGFGSLRVDALLQKVYQSERPDWTQIDGVVAAILEVRLEPLIMVGYTPAWLQPVPNPCGTNAAPYHAPARDPGRWAELAAALVGHFDVAFPGRVHEYEIWNEPDTPAGLCVEKSALRRAVYLRMYAAAARAMRAQARRDGTAIRIGGPAIASPVSAREWMPPLLERGAPRPDFVSYHHYLGDSTQHSATVADPAKSWTVLLVRTRDSRGGIAAGYRRVRRVGRLGREQPSVYLDEYNTTSAYRPDCCRNDPAYAPLWNALVIQEILNGSYRGWGLPSRLMYFAAQDWFAEAPAGTAWFCLFGDLNSRMDCDYSKGNTEAYPQFYAYALIAGKGYLHLADGAHVAPRVESSAPEQVTTSAWYTEGGDSVLISNTGSTERSISLELERTGNVQATATRFLLDREHPQIAAEPLRLSGSGLRWRVRVRLPAYAVLGIFLPVAER